MIFVFVLEEIVLLKLDDNNKRQKLQLFHKEGDFAGQSKGLKQIAIELGYEMPEVSKLDDYKRVLSNHEAFQRQTKFQELAQKYGIKIVYCPKYHYELNPIEGIWCWMKQYVRKRSRCGWRKEESCEMIKEIEVAKFFFSCVSPINEALLNLF
jgi:hypothetical protein